MIPMCLQLVIFSINSCIFQPQVGQVPSELIAVCEFFSGILAFYFLCIEIVTAKDVTRTEFSNSWKELLLNFLSPILILTCQVISFLIENLDAGVNAKIYYWELLAWTSFCLWFRFLLMLRSVERMSPAVSMVLKSLDQIIPYLVVVFIGVFAFSDAFQSIEQISCIRAARDISSESDDFV